MKKIMAILNLTPDSFWEPSRYDMSVLDSDADIIDIGAVSSRPGASPVSMEEEWCRLEPLLSGLRTEKPVSIDTTRSEIVRRAFNLIGHFTVNDISAGEDDPMMFQTVRNLGLGYIAMCRDNNPFSFFEAFDPGLPDWILDPGFGFNKDTADNLNILERFKDLKTFGRPILAGVADKRFTKEYPGGTEAVHMELLRRGADILRVHDVKKARHTLELFEKGGGSASTAAEQSRDAV